LEKDAILGSIDEEFSNKMSLSWLSAVIKACSYKNLFSKTAVYRKSCC